MIKGRIHSFLSMGTVDGPGVRSVIFMQGCPLRCAYCHNPDTWDFSHGKEVELEELLQKILRCKPYYGENGGITVSGGEGLLQPEFVAELMRRCKQKGIHTALDTSGCVTGEAAEKVLEYTDLCLLDVKFDNEEDYKEYTGGSFEKTMEFLELLESKGIPTWVRRVIVPSVNDNGDSVKKLAEIIKPYTCVKKVELLPFRKLCTPKYEMMREQYPEQASEYVFKFGDKESCPVEKAKTLYEAAEFNL